MSDSRTPFLARLSVALAVTLGFGAAVQAQPGLAPVDRASQREITAALRTANGLPNEADRLRGIASYNSGRFVDAHGQFTRAASYADKYSQHRLSLMYWNGEGVARDRALAYVWSDLAAERGQQRLLAIREKMWEALADDERARVAELGPSMYDRYGDDRAKALQGGLLKRVMSNATGSRAGFVTRLEVGGGGPVGGIWGVKTGSNAAAYAHIPVLSDEALYGPQRSNRELYWQTQDETLSIQNGQVEIGGIETIEEARKGR